ncbi:hypothetical protein, partial [Enterobacter asburiae]
STASATIKNAETAPEGVVFFLIKRLTTPNINLQSCATGQQKRSLKFINVGELAKNPRLNLGQIEHKFLFKTNYAAADFLVFYISVVAASLKKRGGGGGGG